MLIHLETCLPSHLTIVLNFAYLFSPNESEPILVMVHVPMDFLEFIVCSCFLQHEYFSWNYSHSSQRQYICVAV